jgi:hypothetical protein
MARTTIAVQQRSRRTFWRRVNPLGIGVLFVPYLVTLLNSVLMGVRTTLALQAVAKNDGVAAVSTSAADSVNGMQFQNDGTVELIFFNSSGGTRTVTVRSVACSHGRTSDRVYAQLNTNTSKLGPFDPALFNQANGMVNVDIDSATGVTVAALQNAGLKQ